MVAAGGGGAGSEQGGMGAEFEVALENFDHVSEHLSSGCSYVMDTRLMIACRDGWFVMDGFERLIEARSEKI